VISDLISRCSPSAVASATSGRRTAPTPTRVKTSQTYYHRNQQYSIVGLTNAAGTLVERYTYNAYGTLGIYAANGTVRTSSTYANRYTYTGREWDAELRLYHFRARWYDPATDGFVSRDPLRYVDGMSLYRGYFVPYGTDPSGESCSATPCIQRCALLPETGWVGFPGGAGQMHPRQLCIDKCTHLAKKFIDWFDEQMRLGKPDNANLPPCPCKLFSILSRPVYFGYCYLSVKLWEVEEYDWQIPPGWYLSPPAGYPLYLERLHPGAIWDLRSNQVPLSQCTYDASGDLITTGVGIGTVDEKGLGGGHLPIDVHPVDWIIGLEGGKLKEGCWFNMYKRMRPLLNGNKCPRNP